MSRSHVTIRDVATRAGVSHQTVSRVINGHERVNPDTRQRVEAAILELNYQPNAIARFMARGRTYTLACLSPNMTDFTFASLIEGAEAQARRSGYFLLTASAPDTLTFATLVEQLVTSRRTEGLLVINPYADDRHTRLPANVPVVFLGARPRSEPVSSVSLDDEAAGYEATFHLLGLGHRQIAHLSGPLCEDCAQDRQAGYLSALRDAGITVDAALIREGDWSATSAYQVIQTWLAQGQVFTALFAQNDRMAIGAIRALRDAGLNVPVDVSVIGFDDMPLASYFDPPLTTMRQDIYLSGCEAARLLIGQLDDPFVSPEHIRLKAQLVERSSTARLGGGATFSNLKDSNNSI
jgi:DNA-binding LacI/PurR family transcriptional regulator